MKKSDNSTITVSESVRKELENRKSAISRRIGKAASYDDMLRVALGMRL